MLAALDVTILDCHVAACASRLRRYIAAPLLAMTDWGMVPHTYTIAT